MVCGKGIGNSVKAEAGISQTHDIEDSTILCVTHP